MTLRPASGSAQSAARFLLLYHARTRRRRRARAWSLAELAALRDLVATKLGDAVAKTPSEVYREVLGDWDISQHMISRALVWLVQHGRANRTTAGGYLIAKRRIA